MIDAMLSKLTEKITGDYTRDETCSEDGVAATGEDTLDGTGGIGKQIQQLSD